MGTVTWDVTPSFPAVLLTMLVSLVVGGAASHAFYLWLDKTDETASWCVAAQTVIVSVAAFTPVRKLYNGRAHGERVGVGARREL